MLSTGTAIKNRGSALTATLSSVARPDTQLRAVDVQSHRSAAEGAIDEVLAESFPASDPPSWNPGIVRPNLVGSLADTPPRDDSRAATRKAAASPIGVVDVSRSAGGELTFLDVASSIAGASAIVLLVPFVILLIGAPIALSVRAVIEAIGWLAAMFSS